VLAICEHRNAWITDQLDTRIDAWRDLTLRYREWAPERARTTFSRASLTELERAINSAREILTGAATDSDDEAAPPASPTAFARAIGFLRGHAQEAERFGQLLPIPQILNGPEQSVDLYWHLDRFEILVNFPADADQPAQFYGDDRGARCIKGTLGTETPGLLLPWLIR
jgi:hypothetical protein